MNNRVITNTVVFIDLGANLNYFVLMLFLSVKDQRHLYPKETNVKFTNIMFFVMFFIHVLD